MSLKNAFRFLDGVRESDYLRMVLRKFLRVFQ